MSLSVSVEKYAQLNGHKGAVYALTNADIPNHVFSAGSDGIIARWDVVNGVSLGALAQIQSPVFSLLYSLHGNLLFAGREDGGLHVIDIISRKEIKLLKNHDKGVFSIIQSGKQVFTSGGDGTVAVIDLHTLQTLKVFKVSEKKVRGLFYSPDKSLLYTASGDGLIRVFSNDFSSPIQQWLAHDEAANTIVQLSEFIFMSGGRDARLKIWDVSTNEPLLLENIPAHNYAIYQIQLYPEMGIFMTCSRDKTIKIWDMLTLQVLTRIQRVGAGGHKNSVNDLVFFPEDGKLVSASDDAAVMVWDVACRIEN